MDEYKINQGAIIAKWLDIIQEPDVYGEGIIAAVRLARWVERQLTQADPDPAQADYLHIKQQWGNRP